MAAVSSEVKTNVAEPAVRCFEVLGGCSTSDVAEPQLLRSSGTLESPLTLRASCSTTALLYKLRGTGSGQDYDAQR